MTKCLGFYLVIPTLNLIMMMKPSSYYTLDRSLFGGICTHPTEIMNIFENVAKKQMKIKKNELSCRINFILLTFLHKYPKLRSIIGFRSEASEHLIVTSTNVICDEMYSKKNPKNRNRQFFYHIPGIYKWFYWQQRAQRYEWIGRWHYQFTRIILNTFWWHCHKEVVDYTTKLLLNSCSSPKRRESMQMIFLVWKMIGKIERRREIETRKLSLCSTMAQPQRIHLNTFEWPASEQFRFLTKRTKKSNNRIDVRYIGR